jgi:hypothetical protein
MPRLVPINEPNESNNEISPKKIRLVPVEASITPTETQVKKETTTQLVPVVHERTKLDQPLLKEANATSISDVPEAVLQVAKQMVIDFPLGIGAFLGGATYDAYDALLKGKFSFENARKAHEYMQTASVGAYNKVRSLVPIGDQKGAEQIVTNLFNPLEKFATKGGEIVTDLTGSEVAGATTYATLQVLPWVLGGKAIEGLKGKTSGEMPTGKLPVDEVPDNPKQVMLDTKAAILQNIHDRIKAVEKLGQEEPPVEGQQPIDPAVKMQEIQKQTQELQDLKQTHQSLGIVNAGEIPEGKTIDLKAEKGSEISSEKGGQRLKDEHRSPEKIDKPTPLMKDIARAVGYKGRKFRQGFEIPTILDSYWIEGSKDTYYFYDLRSGNVKKVDSNHPFFEADKPNTLTDLPEGIALVKQTIFNGKNLGLTVWAKGSTAKEPLKLPDPNVIDAQFTATNNIKEQQKTIAAARQEIVSTSVKEGDKSGRMKLIKERAEAARAARLKEIEDLSHYEDTPDPLTVDTQKTVQETLYKEPEGNAKPVTLGDINKIGKDKEMNVNANIGVNGDMIVSVTDKLGNKVDFHLTKNGITLQNVHDYVEGWTNNFADNMKKQYEVKAEVIDKAPELIKPVGPKKKHVIKATGETIEYQTVADLKEEYASRGLPWTSSKKEYYMKKRIDEPTKAEIDDKLTPISKKSMPEIELLDSQGNGKKPGVLQWTEPFRFVAQDIEQRTGFPMQQFESRIRDGMRQVNSAEIPYLRRIRDAKIMSAESALRVKNALSNPVFRESNNDFNTFKRNINKEQYLKDLFGNMTKAEYESAIKSRKILNDAASDTGIPIDKMILDYAPRMVREGVSGWTEAIQKWSLPEEYKWAALEERTGYLHPQEENIYKLMESYVRRGFTKKYVGNYLEELTKKVNETKLESKADIDQINKYIATMRNWQSGLDETLGTSVENAARVLNKAINKVFGKGAQRYKNEFYKKIDVERKGIDPETGEPVTEKIPRFVKTGEEPGFFDVHKAYSDLAAIHLKLTYAGGIGWRPMVWARAMWQSTLSMPIVGPASFVKGIKKGLSPSGWAEAKAATALFADSPIAAGELSRGYTAIDSVTQAATWDTRSGHNIGRSIAYHAAKDNFGNYGKKFLEDIKGGMSEQKAIDKFIADSGADFFHPVLLRNEIIPLLKAKDPTSLSERMALHTVAETQWMYEKGQAPYWARSTAGRVLGQFGVWPSWYIKYIRNLSSRGSILNRSKRLAGLATINLMSYETGKELFGVDISNWMLTHPVMWTSSTLNALDAARKAFLAHSDYEKEIAKKDLLSAVNMHIPGYMSFLSIVDGMEETRDEDKFKRFMGFKIAEE